MSILDPENSLHIHFSSFCMAIYGVNIHMSADPYCISSECSSSFYDTVMYEAITTVGVIISELGLRDIWKHFTQIIQVQTNGYATCNINSLCLLSELPVLFSDSFSACLFSLSYAGKLSALFGMVCQKPDMLENYEWMSNIFYDSAQ